MIGLATLEKMFLMFPIAVLAIFLKLYFLTELLYKWNYPMSNIPGPKVASWTRLWWLSIISRSKLDQEMKRLQREYGPIVRIAPNSILISDADTTRKVLAVGSRFKRGPWFDSLRLDAFTANVVSERDPIKHQKLRAILGPALSGGDMRDIESTVHHYLKRWRQSIEHKLSTANDQTAEVDLSKAIPLLTLDIMAQLCLDENFECVEKDMDYYDFFTALDYGMLFQPYTAMITEATALLLGLGKLPWFRTWLFPRDTSANGIGRVMQKIGKVVESRSIMREQGVSKKNMLNSFLSRGLPNGQASSEILIVISSGVGATSYAIQAIVRSIVADARVVDNLQREIDGIIARHTEGSFDRVSNSEIKEMPYLHACILEGLRMYPPVFSQLRERVAPPEGVVLNGYAIPGGTYIGFNSIGTQLNYIYGDHVTEYCPERWLIDDDSRLKLMLRNLDLVYGYGNSKCLGINLANLELNMVIFQLFSTYEVAFSNENNPWTSRGDFILKDFRVQLRHRKSTNLTNGFYHV